VGRQQNGQARGQTREKAREIRGHRDIRTVAFILRSPIKINEKINELFLRSPIGVQLDGMYSYAPLDLP
jgi:hypothetical protein